MTRVDFYILPTRDALSRRQFSCRLLEKAYRLGHRIHVLTNDATESREMDELLWTFRAGSFVPHAIHSGTEADSPHPVLISHEAITAYPAEVLINLSSENPPQSGNYQRIAEVVNEERDIKQSARLRYSQYKQQQLALETHHLNTVQ